MKVFSRRKDLNSSLIIDILNTTLSEIVIFNFNLSFSFFIVYSYRTTDELGKTKEKIVYGGYCYYKSKPFPKIPGMKKHYRCVGFNQKALKCKAQMWTEDGIVVEQIGYHTHEPESFSY